MSQLLEFFVVLCTADHFRYAFSTIGNANANAQSKSGPVRPESMPTPLALRISAIQGLTYVVVPALYVLSVVGCGFRQPRWMHAVALPDGGMDALWKDSARVLGCLASIALQSVSNRAFDALGDQFHPIGRREKSKIVQTGPYAWIRHPLYALTLLNEAIWCLMYWSYAPLYALAATATVFAIKIPIEEEAILKDAAVREEYSAYMHKVPAKLVPYLW